MNCLKRLIAEAPSEDVYGSDSKLVAGACKYGNLEALEYLHSTLGLPLLEHHIDRAIPYLDCVRYCHVNGGHKITTHHVTRACEDGALDCLQYFSQFRPMFNPVYTLCSVRAPKRDGVTDRAACLKFLHEQGCPRWFEVYWMAVHACESFNTDVLKFLRDTYGYTFENIDPTKIFKKYPYQGCVMSVFRCLMELGCPLKPTFVEDLVYSLDYLRRYGTTRNLEEILSLINHVFTTDEAVMLASVFLYAGEDLTQFPRVRRLVNMLPTIKDSNLAAAKAAADAAFVQIESDLKRIPTKFSLCTDVIKNNILSFL